MNTHTPGPWHIANGILSEDDKRAFTNPAEITGVWAAGERCVCLVFYGTPDASDRANAKLLAAAPQLLEACRFAVEASMDLDAGRLPEVIDKLQLAIAKTEVTTGTFAPPRETYPTGAAGESNL